MGTSHRIEKFSSREEVLSADLVRLQQLGSKMVQDASRNGSADALGAPISSFDVVPSWSPVAASFNVTLGAGSGHQELATGVGVDDSSFQVLEWPNPTLLTFTTPNATNPRIDLVVATAGTIEQDLSARNVLVDPVARTQVVANVAKTIAPRATISVVAGTPAAGPVAPAVPAGAVALYEVWIPASAPNSGAFTQSPRMFRRAPFPWSTMSGVMTGCHLRWDLTADPATTSSLLSMVGLTHRVVIDGEVVEFSTLFQFATSQDAGAANPFSVAAGTSDKPYYVYLVGGRHAPQGTFTGSNLIPVALVESLTPPDLDNYGRPTAGITTGRGAAPIEACVYVGIGFVVAGTTRRRPCTMTDDMTVIVGSDFGGLMSLTKTATAFEPFSSPAGSVPGSLPSISRKMLARLSLGAAGATGQAHLYMDRGDGVAAAPAAIGVGSLSSTPVVKTQVASNVAQANVVFYFNPANPKIWVGGTGLGVGDSISLTPQGFDHRVARIASQG